MHVLTPPIRNMPSIYFWILSETKKTKSTSSWDDVFTRNYEKIGQQISSWYWCHIINIYPHIKLLCHVSMSYFPFCVFFFFSFWLIWRKSRKKVPILTHFLKMFTELTCRVKLSFVNSASTNVKWVWEARFQSLKTSFRNSLLCQETQFHKLGSVYKNLVSLYRNRVSETRFLR